MSRTHSAKPSRALADFGLQAVMTRDQWDRYATRVAELKRGGLPIAEARIQAQREVTQK